MALPGRRNQRTYPFRIALRVTLGNGPSLVSGAAGAAIGGGLILAAALGETMAARLIGPAAVAAAAGLYTLSCYLLVARAGVFRQVFGLANLLTLARLIITAIFTAFAVQFCIDGAAADQVMWVLLALATGALIIDGLDGLAARRLNLASDFGARFDMEVDALLILVLSVIAVAIGKVGLWVIAGGLLRYAYVLAAYGFPVLSRPLAPAWRRKAIAVIQGATLAALLAPPLQPPVSVIAAGIALALLIYSFGLDILAQVRAP